MSKKQRGLAIGENGYVQVKLVAVDFQYLEGQLLTIIETIGLDSKQEEAIKSLVRQVIWNKWNDTEKEVVSMNQFNEKIVGSGK